MMSSAFLLRGGKLVDDALPAAEATPDHAEFFVY